MFIATIVLTIKIININFIFLSTNILNSTKIKIFTVSRIIIKNNLKQQIILYFTDKG